MDRDFTGLIADSSPEKAGVGGSSPSLATMFSIAYRPPKSRFGSNWFQFRLAGMCVPLQNRLHTTWWKCWAAGSRLAVARQDILGVKHSASAPRCPRGILILWVRVEA